MAEGEMVVPVTRGGKVSERFVHGRGVYVALSVNVSDVSLVGEDQSDRRRLVLGPVCRLAAARLSPRAIAEAMQIDVHVVEMALAEASEMGILAAADKPAAQGRERTRRTYTPVARNLAVFHHPEAPLLGACDRADGVFVHPHRQWSREELGQQRPYWELKVRPPTASAVQPRDVLRIASHHLLSDDLGRMRGAVTVLETIRSVQLLVPLIGRDGDEIVAANPFDRVSTGPLVHDGLSRIMTGMPSHAITALRDRLPDLRAGRELDLDLHWTYRQQCADQLRDLRARLALDGRPAVHGAAGELAFAVTRVALAPDADLDEVTAVLDGGEAIAGALAGLASREQMDWLTDNMAGAVEAVSAQLNGKPTCVSSVLLVLLTIGRLGSELGVASPKIADHIAACASTADAALREYLAAGDFSDVERALTVLVHAVGADRPAQVAKRAHE